MTELFEPLDAYDPRLHLGAPGGGLLAEFNRAGFLTAGDVHLAERVGELGGEPSELVRFAVACAGAVLRRGSVGVHLEEIRRVAPDLPWPDPDEWRAAVEGSRLVDAGVIRLDQGLVYLDRYHRLETQVFEDLVARVGSPGTEPPELAGILDRIFPREGYEEQRAAVAAAAIRNTTVLTGGPGTGKTTTVARLLAVLAALADRPLSIALAAPTGKAAAQLQEAVSRQAADLPPEDRARLEGLEALTIHRLLGWRPDNNTRFRHDRGNRLGHDVVVVDETSMVDLMLMARLLEALRPESRLVLVGDRDQLTSVGAGAVLGDLVRGYRDRPDSPVVSLTRTHRFGNEIGRLADALREGDVDRVLEVLGVGGKHVEWVPRERATDLLRAELGEQALAMVAAGERGDGAEALRLLDEHRLICAHRDGPAGVSYWNRTVERWLAAASGQDFWPRWYPGRPLLVTGNDYGLGIYNGETGVVYRARDGSLRGVIGGPGGDPRLDLAVTRLEEAETMHALTVHKSQGSQADRVSVLLPAEDSRLLTRELFYTAVTRAREFVRVIGSEAEVRAAVARRAQRATGLAERIRDS
jgi:exodeoxyribonuclease V alpha subunit